MISKNVRFDNDEKETQPVFTVDVTGIQRNMASSNDGRNSNNYLETTTLQNKTLRCLKALCDYSILFSIYKSLSRNGITTKRFEVKMKIAVYTICRQNLKFGYLLCCVLRTDRNAPNVLQATLTQNII